MKLIGESLDKKVWIGISIIKATYIQWNI